MQIKADQTRVCGNAGFCQASTLDRCDQSHRPWLQLGYINDEKEWYLFQLPYCFTHPRQLQHTPFNFPHVDEV